MNWRALRLLPILALVSCSTAPKMDPLEAKAAEGDPVAACQFAARNIHACALEKQKWRQSAAGDKPTCLSEPSGANSDLYFDKAEATLDAKTASPDSSAMAFATKALFLSLRANLMTSELAVMIGEPDKAVESTRNLDVPCSALEQ